MSDSPDVLVMETGWLIRHPGEALRHLEVGGYVALLDMKRGKVAGVIVPPPPEWEDAPRLSAHRLGRKLTITQADEIRERHAAGETEQQLADVFGIDKANIHRIISGERYRSAAPRLLGLRDAEKILAS